MSKKISADSLQLAAELIMKKYDTDNNGILDADEIYLLIKDSRDALGIKKTIKKEDIDTFLTSAKATKQDKLTQEDLMEALKEVIA